MDDPKMQLVWQAFATARDELARDAQSSSAWARAEAGLAQLEAQDAELAAAISAHDVAALTLIVEGWESGQRVLPEQDRALLKRAMKAYRKRLKITVLDAESSLGGGPMSSGRESDIVGISPPERYPRAIWDELARQGRLVKDRQGTYELPPGG